MPAWRRSLVTRVGGGRSALVRRRAGAASRRSRVSTSFAVPQRADADVHPRRRPDLLLRAERAGPAARRLVRRRFSPACCGGSRSPASPGTCATCRASASTGRSPPSSSFLVWVYLSAVILLYGVEVTAVRRSKLRKASRRSTPTADVRSRPRPHAASDEARRPRRPRDASEPGPDRMTDVQSSGRRTQSVSPAARQQSGRLVSVGRRGVRRARGAKTSRSFCRSATRPATGAT